MSDVTGAPDFEAALGDLQDHLPAWWRSQDPTSQLYLLLDAIAASTDDLSVLWEQPYLDQVLVTASQQGLERNFAFAWGLLQEQLPTVLPQLEAYIQARTVEDGSLQSLVNTLTALVNTPANITGGPVLTLPATFPADGSGLSLYEFPPGQQPTSGLIFPADGSGLIFPIDPASVPSDNVIVDDGTTPIGAGPGLTFSQNGFITILRDFPGYRMTVQVQNWLAFDRGAFARAVHRFQIADWLPTVIEEVTSYH